MFLKGSVAQVIFKVGVPCEDWMASERGFLSRNVTLRADFCWASSRKECPSYRCVLIEVSFCRKNYKVDIWMSSHLPSAPSSVCCCTLLLSPPWITPEWKKLQVKLVHNYDHNGSRLCAAPNKYPFSNVSSPPLHTLWPLLPYSVSNNTINGTIRVHQLTTTLVYCLHQPSQRYTTIVISTMISLQGCGVWKITRSPKVPNHEILGAKNLRLYEKIKFFQSLKGKS